MTDTEKLKQKIKESGYRIAFIAERLGLSYPGFKKKVDNESEFKASEILSLTEMLGLSAEEQEAIFFVAE